MGLDESSEQGSEKVKSLRPCRPVLRKKYQSPPTAPALAPAHAARQCSRARSGPRESGPGLSALDTVIQTGNAGRLPRISAAGGEGMAIPALLYFTLPHL